MEDRRQRKKPMPDEKRAAIFADIRLGLTQRALAKKYHIHTDRVRAFQIEAGSPMHHPRCFTTADVARIRKMIQEGKTNGEIARELKCTSGAIWLRRKREGQKNQEAIAA